jgi:hypothetical protein
MSSLEEKIEMIKDNKISEIYLGELEIDVHWAGKITEALKVNSSLQSIDLEENKIGAEGAGKIADALKVNSSLQSINLGYSNIEETLFQEINNSIERNVVNLKLQQKLASVCLFEALSEKRGRLDWNVVIFEFFPLLGGSKIN